MAEYRLLKDIIPEATDETAEELCGGKGEDDEQQQPC